MSLTSLKFRTFGELLDSVLIDFRKFDSEGMIEPAELVKIAQRVNYDLGLKIHRHKETIIDICDGKGKLPEDFHVLKLAFLMGKYKVLQNALPPGGRITENFFTPATTTTYLPVYSWSVTPYSASISVTVTARDGSTSIVSAPQGETTIICANSVVVAGPVSANIDTITRGASCDPLPAADCPCPTNTSNCNIDTDAFGQSMVYTVCGGTANVAVIQKCHNQEIREYTVFEKLEIKKSKWTDPACMNTMVSCPMNASIKDGFLYTSFPYGKVFLSYLGNMEDEDGNLLVLSQEKCDPYYEWALKVTILENLYFANEDVAQKLQLAESRLKAAKIDALNFINMPDFADIRNTFLLNRKVQINKYYSPFHTNLHNQWGL